MKYIWLLPDFDQSGVIKAWGDDMSSFPMSVSACKDIPLRELPDCFVLGIPESLLRGNVEQDFVYAQYVRLNSKKSILCFSIRGGSDKSGRTVVLTMLQFLAEGESLVFPPEAPSDLPTSIERNELIAGRIKAMIRSFNSSENIRDMISAVEKYPKIQTFASEYTDSLVQQPQWTPRKKKEYNLMVGIFGVFILLIILMIAF